VLSRTYLIALCIGGVTVAVSAAPQAGDEACSLLTSAQVSAVTNTPMGEGVYMMPTFRKTCTWTASHPAPEGVKIVTVSFEGLDMFTGGMKAGRNPGVSATAVSGVGDSAYYLVAGGIAALHVKKGDLALKVAVYAKLPPEQVEAMEKKLAVEVVPRL
jgi:hypothetical protein